MHVEEGRPVTDFRTADWSTRDQRQGLTVLYSLQELVKRHAPDCVLLAGDLVDDAFGPRNLYWQRLSEFLAFLGQRHVPVLAVRGNKDDSNRYEAVSRLPGFHDISERLVRFRGIAFLGVSHAATKNLRYMRQIAQRHSGRIDIVLAHAEFRRRPWLFSLAAQMLVTGHFDTRLSKIAGRAFLSLWSSPSQHAVIDISRRDWRIALFVAVTPEGHRHATSSRAVGKDHVPIFKAVALKRGGKLCFRSQPHAFRSLAFRTNYAAEVTSLLRARTKVSQKPAARQTESLRLTRQGVSKTLVREFLALA